MVGVYYRGVVVQRSLHARFRGRSVAFDGDESLRVTFWRRRGRLIFGYSGLKSTGWIESGTSSALNRCKPTLSGLRCTSQRDDWQMAASAMVADFKVETIARLPSDERVRSGTGGPARPASSWFDTRKPIGGTLPEINLIRCPAVERHVRAILVIPFQKGCEFTTESPLGLWNQDPASAFILESPDDALHDGNAAVLAHGTKPGPDFLAPTPVFELPTPEDSILVANEVYGG